MPKACRTWDRHNPWFLGQQPGKGNLCWSGFLEPRLLSQEIQQRHVRLERFGGEAWVGKAVVGVARLVELGIFVDRSGEQSQAQRACVPGGYSTHPCANVRLQARRHSFAVSCASSIDFAGARRTEAGIASLCTRWFARHSVVEAWQPSYMIASHN